VAERLKEHMRLSLRCTLALVALWTVADAPRSAVLAGPQQQTAPPQQPPPTEPVKDPQNQPIRARINFVRVDVIVSDKQGNPVLDMAQDDFQVSEDGKPQKIETFSVVKIDEASQLEGPPPSAIRSKSDEEREAAKPDVRLFVILFDDYHVRRGNDMAVRKPLMDFVQNQLAPADMVAIMYPLTPVDDIQFSRNRESLISGIQSFEGRKHNYEPRNAFEQQYAYYPAQTVERIRNQVTMSALKAAAVRLGGLREGRKSIIFVSEGFTSLLPPQMSDPVAAMPGYGNPNRGNPTVQATDRQQFAAATDLLVEMQEVFARLNRENTSVYAVDPRGLAVFQYDVSQPAVGLETDRNDLRASLDTLHTLANNTDGRAIVNRNDIAVGMKQIIRDSSGYYLLGYTSSQAPTDGKFHEIKVRVKRSGVQVRARKGYWALSAEDAERANRVATTPEPPKALTNALSAIVEPARGRPARFWVGTTRAESGATRVTFVWEAIPPAPGERQEISAMQVSLTATAPDGRPLFRGRTPEPDAKNSASVGPPWGQVSFEAPPGPLQLRISVEGGRGQVLDSTVRELTVPDYTTVQVALGTPRIYRARTMPQLQAIKGDPNATPTVSREFSRTERLLIRVEAFAPGGVQPAITMRLLNRGGTAMSDLPVQMSGTVASVEIPLAGFAAGEYILELNAKAEAGSAQELLAFRIGR
jgi:VWFA-related protein